MTYQSMRMFPIELLVLAYQGYTLHTAGYDMLLLQLSWLGYLLPSPLHPTSLKTNRKKTNKFFFPPTGPIIVFFFIKKKDFISQLKEHLIQQRCKVDPVSLPEN